MPGCFIGTNIRKIQDCIDFATEEKKDWVILFLDFQKAFDSVSHVFLFTLLSSIGFPPTYIAWIMLLYNQAESIVCNKGWLSQKFTLGQGVRQGCPLSCHLFNLVGQIIIFYLQSMGIFAWWTFQSYPNSLYADDIALVLEGCAMIPRVVWLIQWCGQFTGLQLNVDKMVAYAPNIKIPTIIAGVHVSNELVKYLGIWVGDSPKYADKMFTDILTKIHKVISRWKARSMTLGARVLVLKCMVFSIGTHMLMNVFLTNDMLDVLQKIANNFLWCGRNRVSAMTCYNTLKWGGLNQLHMRHFVCRLHVRWICCLWQDKGSTWSIFAWQWVTKHIPETVIPGMVCCSEQILQRILHFYAAALRSFALVNRLNVSQQHLSNIWASSEYPGIFKPMVDVGYIEIGYLPVKGGAIDFRTIQMKLQQAGYVNNIFLLCAALQSKFHAFLGQPVSERLFLSNLYKVAKKVLQIECQHLFDLAKWELHLGTIDFATQQAAFRSMLHHCKVSKFFEVNFKILHHILATPSLISKIRKDPALEQCHWYQAKADKLSLHTGSL